MKEEWKNRELERFTAAALTGLITNWEDLSSDGIQDLAELSIKVGNYVYSEYLRDNGVDL